MWVMRIMILIDIGIFLQIIGFVLLLFVGNRNPTGAHLLLESHKDDPFDLFRERIIPDKYVHTGLIISIIIIVVGLVLQLSTLSTIQI